MAPRLPRETIIGWDYYPLDKEERKEPWFLFPDLIHVDISMGELGKLLDLSFFICEMELRPTLQSCREARVSLCGAEHP